MANPARYSSNTQVKDLLRDDYFIISMYNPTPESQAFWKELIKHTQLDEQTFQEAREILLTQQPEISNEISNNLWERIASSNQEKQNKLIWLKYASTAAAILLFLGLSIWQYQSADIEFDKKESLLVENLKRGDEIRLITADNQQINITGTEAHIDYSNFDSVKINNTRIHKDQQLGEVAYNTIIVPYGKRTSIILADNSKIWINAGTTVKYPVEFNGQTRTIYVEGEVYGDISRDPNKPFIFKTEKFDVKVLGTSLNVSAYQNESLQSVVLVSGAVKVQPKSGQEKLLSPSQAFFTQEEAQVVKTVNTDLYTTWTDGYYQFKDQKLENIIANIRRYYGVEISLSQDIKNMIFTGSLELKDDVSRVLSGLSNSISITLSINNGKYMLTKK